MIFWYSTLVDPLQTNMLSIYYITPSISGKIIFIISQNETGVFISPKGIAVYLKSSFFVRKVIFHLSPHTILIRLNPFSKLSLVSYLAYPPLSINSLISGSRYSLKMRTLLRPLQSTHSYKKPSFCHTNNIEAVTEDRDLYIFSVGRLFSIYLQRATFSSQIGIYIRPKGGFNSAISRI